MSAAICKLGYTAAVTSSSVTGCESPMHGGDMPHPARYAAFSFSAPVMAARMGRRKPRRLGLRRARSLTPIRAAARCESWSAVVPKAQLEAALAQSIALVPVFTSTLQGQLVQLVDARTLHAFMGVLRDFSSWIKGRISKFGFISGVDYVVPNSGATLFTKSGENLGGRPCIAYHLTLDMAKELAMVENNAKGREARRYFIDCERQLQSQYRPEMVQIAMTGANAIAARVHSAAFEQFMKEGGFEHGRWLLSFSSSREGSQPSIRAIPCDAYVMSFDKLTKAVGTPGELWLSNSQLATMAQACNKELSERFNRPALKVAA